MAKNVALHPGSVDFDAEAETEWAHMHVGIPALFTVYNTLDAVAACWNLGVPLGECADALAKNHGVKGAWRSSPRPARATPSSTTIPTSPTRSRTSCARSRALPRGGTVVLFGCGGDRDKTKRPSWQDRRGAAVS